MKKLNFYWMALLALMTTLSFTACSDDDDPKTDPVTDPVEEVTPYHFDLTVTVGKQGGMGRDVTTIMQSIPSLEGTGVVDFKNVGAEINADYSMEAIVKGKYYYQVPVSADRFVRLSRSRPTPTTAASTHMPGSTTTRWLSWLLTVIRTPLSGRS